MSEIDDYLKKINPSQRKELERIRVIAKKIVPEAEDTITYGMPTLKYKGKGLIGFDAHKNHIGIYPYSGQVVEELKEKLGEFELTKGAIRVMTGTQISEALLKEVIMSRIKQIEKDL